MRQHIAAPSELASAPAQVHSREATLAAWRTRLQRVTDWLVGHLDQPFDLDRLADLAHFSPYHFHRIYSTVMQEPVAETVRRMRLHRAAVMLSTSELSVLRVAKQAGYGSVQAFGRAFGQTYGLPPARYRQHVQSSAALVQQAAAAVRTAIHTGTSPNPKESLMQNPPPGHGPMAAVQLVRITPARVAAWPHRGSYNRIGDSFQKLSAWAVGRGLIGAHTQMIGIYYDDPASKPEADLRSEACISVPDDWQLSEADAPVHITSASGGLCARAVFTGPYDQLHTAYTWLYSLWLPQSGHEPGDAPPIEIYLNDPRSNPPSAWQTAICIPLKAGSP